MELDTLYTRLRSLTVFRFLLREPVMEAAAALVDAMSQNDAQETVIHWAELVSLLQNAGAPVLGQWLWDAVRYTENPWGAMVEAGGDDPALDAAAARDVDTLSALCTLSVGVFYGDLDLIKDLPEWADGCPFTLDALKDWYAAHGCGLFARYRAFLWDGGKLLGVERPDIPDPAHLIGYRLQRGQVEDNTHSLLAGNRVNNVLLFGDSGTGKSATVKSLLSLPGAEELRLIEIEKNSVHDMPALIRSLAHRRQKFILFLDDLAFDEDDMNYSVLKTILEGGLEPRPANVAIYATSNRRNLVRQTFSSREGDEVDRDETIQEKTALADRFGLRIPYLSFTKGEYLELVEHLAAQAGVDLPPEQLTARAVRWDARHPGRSPRTAQQFIASLLA